MVECGSLGLLVSSGGTVRAPVSSHSHRLIMKKKLNNGTSKRKSLNVAEDKEPGAAESPPKATSLDDEDQGFGGWLKSDDGLETMKLFVIANSIVMLTTIVYPHIQSVFAIVSDMLFGDDLDEAEFL